MASGGETGFTLAVATEAGAAEQLNQILAAWQATADRGVPLELVEVEHTTKYALDVRNKDTTSSLVARFRNAAGENLLTLVKEAMTIGKPTTFSGAAAFDDDVTIGGGLNTGTGTGAARPGQIAAVNTAINTTEDFVGIHGYYTKIAGVTDFDDSMYGLYARMILDDAADDVGHLWGAYVRAQIDAGSVGTAGNVRDIYGFNAMVNGNAGTVTGNVYGAHVYVDLEAAMTSIGGDVIGLSVNVDADKEPTGSVYMLYLTEQNNVDHCIFQDGTAPSTFGGCIADGTCEIFTEDALSIIRDIRTHGTGKSDEHGHERWDMKRVHAKYPFLIQKVLHTPRMIDPETGGSISTGPPENRYFDKLGAKSDLLYRAAMQLNDHRLNADAERAALKAEIAGLQRRLDYMVGERSP